VIVKRLFVSPIQVAQTRSNFIRTHNKALALASMGIGNEDCSPAGNHA